MKGKHRDAVPGRATKSPVDCPHCKRFFRCADCERNQAEVGLIAHEIVFWRYQAIWYRARIYCSQPQEPDSVDLKRAEIDLERARQDENRERYAHAEPPRDVGS